MQQMTTTRYSTTNTMPKANKIPDRWENYSSFGDVIKGTNILPLKVPLKMSLSSRLPEKERFTPNDFLDKLDDMNYKLGLLIDLTATTRYYNPTVFMDRDVQYVKVFTPGHVVPSSEVIDEFTSAVLSFKEYNRDNELLIGVHCTHGVNRTGYLICRYLIEQEGYKPEDALKAFNEARGYPIERMNYVEDLLQLSGDRRESVQSKGSHVEHFQGKRKNDHYRTRNNYDHDQEIRRGHHQRFHDPYHWNGGAPQLAYGNTLQKKSFWGRGGEGNWRRDRRMDYEGTWNAWQGDGAYDGGWNGAGWSDRNGPNWRQDGAQHNWRSYNQRTPQRGWYNRPQGDKSGTWRNIHNTGY